ncbi:DMT family transporter [Clostridium grantii]|uniref:RarD protein n=1 Tax=Clostridium grantii DSM 8605 TaxID=1121316 RepID=A0A1M5T7S3_9CLOT|nr:EamA family transporter [Clostridium grantii]SHH46738.1 rarD protein [Clostridium grantii DSM 8605]
MKSSFKIVFAMIIWGSLGLFVKNIEMPSMEIAFFRAIIATFILLSIGIIKKDLNIRNYSKMNLILLMASGIAMGFNWVLLFQAYKFTSISNATLSYYFAPVFVVMAAPIVLKEKLSIKKILSVLVALGGLVLIINNGAGETLGKGNDFIGIAYGLSAAVLYATVIFLNKRVVGLTGFERTIVQLAASVVVLIPFVIVRNNINFSGSNSLIFMIIVGVVHTALAYILYFSGIKDTEVNTAAMLSYIDPISALLLGALVLGEGITIWQICGGVMILGASFFVELKDLKLKRRKSVVES